MTGVRERCLLGGRDERDEKPEEPKGLEAQCWAALERVVDPELGVDAVSLGLIYRLEVKGSEVEIDMTMTSPGCPVAEQLLLEANNEVLKVQGVEKARVNLVWSPPWSPK